MAKLSVTVITRNEAGNLAAALDSVAWADEIVVVDSGSTDETTAIARKYTDRVFVHPWPGFAEQKNHAASLASHDWILSLDADERVSPALGESIRAVMTSPAQPAYRCSRVTWHLGRWLHTTDWYPDYQTRLYDRRKAEWRGRHVHEALVVEGSVGRLRGDLQHYAYKNIADHLETIDRYTTLAARKMHEEGCRPTLLQMAVHPAFAFFRNYVLRGGFRDGRAGFVVSSMNACYVFLKFAKTWEMAAAQAHANGSQARVTSNGLDAKSSTGV